MESSVPEDIFSTSFEFVKDVVDKARKIVIAEMNDAQKAGDMETCSSASSEKEKDSVGQTTNDPLPHMIDKDQENRIEEADEVEAELSPAHSSSDINLASDIVHESIDNAKEKWKMHLETECVRINTKSEPIYSQPCLSNDAVKEPVDAEKNQTAKTLQAEACLASVPNDNKNAIGSSRSLNEDELYGSKKEVPLTRASAPNLKYFASPRVIAVSPAVASPQESSEKKNASKPETFLSPSLKSESKDSSSTGQHNSLASSGASRASRTVSVGLLGVTVGSSSEPNLSSGIFELQNPPSYRLSPTRIAVSSSPAPSSCSKDLKEELQEQDYQRSSTDIPSAQLSNKDVSNEHEPSAASRENGVITDLGNLTALKDFIVRSSVQTEEGQDIFVIDPSKIPGKRDFDQKEDFKGVISSLCLYSRSYIQANIMSDKFVLVVHAPNDTRSRMKSRESVKKFYKLLKDSFSERLIKCVICRPEFKLKAFVHICRPFLRNSMRNKFFTARNKRNLVEVYGVPENAVEMLR